MMMIIVIIFCQCLDIEFRVVPLAVSLSFPTDSELSVPICIDTLVKYLTYMYLKYTTRSLYLNTKNISI